MESARVIFLLVCLALLFGTAWLLLRQDAAQLAPRPHIVFVLADDLGWNDVSYHGCPQIRTPNIDALAWNGIRLRRYYAQPLCTPSRAALLSGRYPLNLGLQHSVIYNEEPRGLPLSVSLLPQWLAKLGYATHILGKWHVGFCKEEYTPTMRGFQRHVGFWGAYIDYYKHEKDYLGPTRSPGLDMRRDFLPAPNDTGRYITHLLTEEAVAVIEGHPDDKPLFLYLAHLAPHSASLRDPLQVPDKYVEPYRDIGSPERMKYAGGVPAELGDIDGVSHADSLAANSTSPPRTELVVNIDPVDNYSAIIEGHFKLVAGVAEGGKFEHWYPIVGNVNWSSTEPLEQCEASSVARVLTSLGLDPACGLGGGTYPTPIDCGSRDPEKTCRPTVAPCLFDLAKDPCEYNDVAPEHPELVKSLLAKLGRYKAAATPPANLPHDPLSDPGLYNNVWIPWREKLP
ncbi:arylsulfatase B-like isoform X3 [Amblyomma americanum]